MSKQCSSSGPLQSSLSRNPSKKSHVSESAEMLLSDGREWWMEDLPTSLDTCSDDDLEEGDVSLPEGWWGATPPQYHGPKTLRAQRGFFGVLRSMVGCGRRRYQANGFDLDLSYVTTKVIAMGFPCSGISAAWRNPQSEVERFLSWAHEDFRIFNLCSEQSYQQNGFPEETMHFPSPDHCPVQLSMLYRLCQELESWLRGGEKRVAALHCKAGKGRTGTCICALLVYAGALTAYDSVRWYARYRGGRTAGAGVTIPSQVRWIAMFERFCRLGDADLRSNPIDPPGTLAYWLHSVQMGPFGPDMLEGRHGAPVIFEVTVAVSSRDDVTSRKVAFSYEPQSLEPNEDGFILLQLDEEAGPIWRLEDGLLSIKVAPGGHMSCCPARCCKCFPKQEVNLQAWWSHAFMEMHAGLLHLRLPRGYIDSERSHSRVPTDFELHVLFKDASNTIKASE